MKNIVNSNNNQYSQLWLSLKWACPVVNLYRWLTNYLVHLWLRWCFSLYYICFYQIGLSMNAVVQLIPTCVIDSLIKIWHRYFYGISNGSFILLYKVKKTRLQMQTLVISDTARKANCKFSTILQEWNILFFHTNQTNKLRGLSQRANYTDRAAAACRRS
jgi:hypothetical protein